MGSYRRVVVFMTTLFLVLMLTPLLLAPLREAKAQGGVLEIYSDFTLSGDYIGSIMIMGGDLTLDLGGHSIISPDPGTQWGIYAYNQHNVTIKNGSIYGFQHGIQDSSSFNVIDSINVSNNAKNGIDAIGCNYMTVKNCTFVNNGEYGLKLGPRSGVGTSGHVVTDNTFLNNELGILESNNCTISGNTVDGASIGCYGSGGIGGHPFSNSSVTGNEISSSSSAGIYLQFSEGSRIEGNIVRECGEGISIHSGQSNTIKGNTIISNNNGISIYSSNNNIEDNEISLSTYTGINFYYACGGNVLRRNNISDCGYGIWFYQPVNAPYEIHDIDTSNSINGRPIYYLVGVTGYEVPKDASFLALMNCSNISAEGLTLSNNRPGVLACGSHGCLFENLEIAHNNDTGLHFQDSSNNVIRNCNIYENDDRGIWLSNSSHNTILKNSIESNGYFGLDVGQGAIENQVYHNNFIDNVDREVHNLEANNLWDNGYPSGGNYWSDLIIQDEFSGPNQDQPGSDQINDSPYEWIGYFATSNFVKNGEDRYPLVAPVNVSQIPQEGYVGGAVADAETGNPLQGISVTAYNASTGRLSGSAITGSNGYYILGSLQPGNYKVRFTDSQGNYPSAWYNNRPYFNSADLVDVNAGLIEAGVNVALSPYETTSPLLVRAIEPPLYFDAWSGMVGQEDISDITLTVQNEKDIWFKLMPFAQGGAAYSTNGLLAELGYLAPGTHTSYKGIFDLPGQIIGVKGEYATGEMQAINTVMLYIKFVIDVIPIPSNLPEIFEYIKEIPEISKAVGDFNQAINLARRDNPLAARYLLSGVKKIVTAAVTNTYLWEQICKIAGKKVPLINIGIASGKIFYTLWQEFQPFFQGVIMEALVHFECIQEGSGGGGTWSYPTSDPSFITTLGQAYTLNSATSSQPITGVYPEEGSIIGTNQLLGADIDSTLAMESVLFEYSLDGDVWEPIELVSAPLPGLSSYYTELDSTEVPEGLVMVRWTAIDFEREAYEPIMTTYTISHATPPAVIGLTASSVPGGVSLAWQEASCPDLEGYLIYRSAYEEGPFEDIAATIVELDQEPNSYTDHLDQAEGPYYYRVRAFNSLGTEGDPSATVLSAQNTDAQAPNVVYLSPEEAEVVGPHIYLAAQAEDEGTVESFNFSWSQDGGQTWTPIGEEEAYNEQGTNTWSSLLVWEDSPICEGEVAIKAEARDSYDNTSDPLVHTCTYDITPPSDPIGLTAAHMEAGTVLLEWQASSDDHLHGYNVFRKTGDGDYSYLAFSETESFQDAGLAPGAYTYKVLAQDEATNLSGESNEASIALLPGTITGTITAASGDPIPGARAVIYSGETDAYLTWAEAGPGGTFSIEDLLEGTYKIYFFDPSGAYVPQWYDGLTSRPSEGNVTVTAGETTTIDASLSPPALSGTITTASGDPIPGARAVIYSGETDAYITWTGAGSDGAFTVNNLPAGTYKVYFFDPSGTYVPEWYDDQPARPAEGNITVTAGETTTVDASLSPPALTGTITSPDGETPIPGARAVVYSGETDAYITWAGAGTGGAFSIENLPAGTYKVYFFDPSGTYVPEWYDDLESRPAEGNVNVTAGETATIDASLEPR